MKAKLTLTLALALAAGLHAQDKTAPAAPTTTPAGQPVPAAGTNRLPPSAKAAAAPMPVIPGNATNAPARPAGLPPPPTFPLSPGAKAAPTLAAPALPTLPVGGVNAALAPMGTNAPAKFSPRKDKVIPPGVLKFVNTPLDQVLEYYAELVGRTVLRSPAVIGTTTINLKSQTELTVEEAIQAIDSMLALNGVVTIPVGEKFITIVPQANSPQEAAAFNTSTNAADLPEAGQYITKVIQLKEVKPSEIVPVIQPFAKVQGGILPIDTTQVLIIRDYAINVKRMMELIEKIDQAVPLEENMRVFPIRYALASEVGSVLGTLRSAGSSGAPAGTPARSSTRNGIRQQTTGQPGGFQGINTGAPGTATPYGAVPGALPTPTQPSAAASNFQNRLQQIVRNAASTGTAQLLGAARIIPYERNNSILAIGTKQELEMVEKLINELDKVQKQVLIEALILEVTLDTGRQVGISAAQNPKSFANGYSGRGGIRTDTIFGSSLTNASNSSLPQGFSYFANLGPTWEVAIQAAATDSTVNVLSRPRIQTSHGEVATLFVGDTVPYINSTYANLGGTPTSSYQQKDIGIQLSVQPLINEDGLVVMDIVQNVEQLGPSQKIDNNDVPTTTKRNAQARVAVKDGETIILGGFISTQKSKSTSGVPGLKDIPYLGYLFKSTKDTSKRVELIVLIRPTVLPTPEVAAVTATQERGKLTGVERAVKEIQEEDRLRAEKNKREIEKRERGIQK
ncbi:MAG: hypothetical protein HY300_04270 [Verrucomicrobia bacterium]|nr:hypothetical protein [Verrucomicrobiota bacterium]